MKNQVKIKNLLDPITIKDAVLKAHVTSKFNDLSIIKKPHMLTSTKKI